MTFLQHYFEPIYVLKLSNMHKSYYSSNIHLNLESNYSMNYYVRLSKRT